MKKANNINKDLNWDYPNEPKGYRKMVNKFEKMGLTTSDAQGAADAYFKQKENERGWK